MIISFNYFVNAANLIITNTLLRFYKLNWYFWLRSLFRKIKRKSLFFFIIIIRFNNIKFFWRRIRKIEFIFAIFDYKIKRN